MRVYVSPDRVYEDLGAVRYRLTWELLKPEAEGKEDIDFDRDLDYRSGTFKTKKAAINNAKRLVKRGNTFFGVAIVTKQVVDWLSEADSIAEWSDTNDRETVEG